MKRIWTLVALLLTSTLSFADAAIAWLKALAPLSLQSLMESALAEQSIELPSALLTPFCAMVPLMGSVSLGIISDVTPDLNVEIDLSNGAITAL